MVSLGNELDNIIKLAEYKKDGQKDPDLQKKYN